MARRVRRAALFVAVAAFVAACAPAPVGSLGAVLAQDAATLALRVRDLPDTGDEGPGGLACDDELLLIDGRHTAELGPAEIRARLRGRVGDPIALTVVRAGAVLHVTVRRRPLLAPGEAPPPSRCTERPPR